MGELTPGGAGKGRWGWRVRRSVDPTSRPVQIDPVPARPQAGVVAAEKMWSGMGPGSWPWTASFTLAALCVLRAGPSSGASISTPWRGGHIVRAAMW